MRTLLFLMLVAPTLSAQTFFPVPDPLLVQEVAPEQATECYIFFENPGGDSLRLRWKTVEQSYPSGWIVDLCDFGLCYVGIPASGLMNPVVGAERPYLKLIVQPGTTPGAGWVGFRVWEDGNPTNHADVFFSLHTPGVTSAPEIGQARLRVFPNPTSGVFFVDNTGNRPLPMQLTDVGGQLIWTDNVAPGERQMVDLAAWPAGSYFLKTADGTRVVQRVR